MAVSCVHHYSLCSAGGQDEESERRQAEGGGGPWHEHQEYHHHRLADDVDVVCCSLHLGDQLRLLQSQHRAGFVRTGRVSLEGFAYMHS